jgi:predicted nucleic acid-binding protein
MKVVLDTNIFVSAYFHRKKFNLNNDEVDDYIKIVESLSVKIICQNEPEGASRDKDDNKILQCGIGGNVDYIITGDNDLLVLGNYNKIRIINSNEYLNIVNSAAEY